MPKGVDHVVKNGLVASDKASSGGESQRKDAPPPEDGSRMGWVGFYIWLRAKTEFEVVVISWSDQHHWREGRMVDMVSGVSRNRLDPHNEPGTQLASTFVRCFGGLRREISCSGYANSLSDPRPELKNSGMIMDFERKWEHGCYQVVDIFHSLPAARRPARSLRPSSGEAQDYSTRALRYCAPRFPRGSPVCQLF